MIQVYFAHSRAIFSFLRNGLEVVHFSGEQAARERREKLRQCGGPSPVPGSLPSLPLPPVNRSHVVVLLLLQAPDKAAMSDYKLHSAPPGDLSSSLADFHLFLLPAQLVALASSSGLATAATREPAVAAVAGREGGSSGSSRERRRQQQ